MKQGSFSVFAPTTNQLLWLACNQENRSGYSYFMNDRNWRQLKFKVQITRMILLNDLPTHVLAFNYIKISQINENV